MKTLLVGGGGTTFPQRPRSAQPSVLLYIIILHATAVCCQGWSLSCSGLQYLTEFVRVLHPCHHCNGLVGIFQTVNVLAHTSMLAVWLLCGQVLLQRPANHLRAAAKMHHAAMLLSIHRGNKHVLECAWAPCRSLS